MTIRELIKEYDEGSDWDVAAAILARLKVNKAATEVLLEVVVDAVRSVRRLATQRVERQVFVGRAKGKDIREWLAEETFAVGDGRRIKWLDATVAEHEERIAYQERLIGSIASDVERHRLAIKLITDHGVTTLRDVPDEGRSGLMDAA